MLASLSLRLPLLVDSRLAAPPEHGRSFAESVPWYDSWLKSPVCLRRLSCFEHFFSPSFILKGRCLNAGGKSPSVKLPLAAQNHGSNGVIFFFPLELLQVVFLLPPTSSRGRLRVCSFLLGLPADNPPRLCGRCLVVHL